MRITDEQIKKICSPSIHTRGMEYFREGRVHLRKREDDLLSAVVDDECLYNVMIKFSDNEIKQTLCTCAYYETMGCACKHIVATLMQRQIELNEGVSFNGENDKIAKEVCSSFANKLGPKNIIYVRFHLYVTQPSLDVTNFSMALEMGSNKGEVQGIENFLEQYIMGKSFKIDRYTEYIPSVTEFASPQKEIIDILAETYENHSNKTELYSKATYQISFGTSTAVRILHLLEGVDFSLSYNGMSIPDVRIEQGDPDIIIDIDAVDGGISLCVNERGYSLSRNGEYFLYDGIIYHTSEEWRSYFMPIYRALATESRTQITFEGENRISFAAYVLPQLKDKQGVITTGIDELVVNTKPEFEIYFDMNSSSVTAVIIARYGSVAQSLPMSEDKTKSEQIVVRDVRAETEMLAFFEGFSYNNGTFTLNNSDKIYTFLNITLKELENRAKIFKSASFENIHVNESDAIGTTVSYNSKENLLETELTSTLNDEELQNILDAIRLKKSFYRLNDGRFVSLDNPKKANIFNLLNQLDFSQEEIARRKKYIPTYHAMYLDSLPYVDKTKSFDDYINEIKKITPTIPHGLSNVLRAYQKTGLKWLKQLSHLGFGGILADDMGLGKTLQVLAYVKGERPKRPVLIVAPSALIYNWHSEIIKFIPSLKTLIIDGAKEQRRDLINTVDDYEIVITSYTMLRRDITMYSKIQFSYCFIDEAQYIKNARTKNAISVKKIDAMHKFALTGTPIENSILELWSIFDFVMSGYLGTLSEFRNKYMSTNGQKADSLTLEQLRERVKPFIMRRMKADVLEELPEKIEHTMYADLTGEQKDMYIAHLSLAKKKTMSMFEDGSANSIQILSLLTRLRQICCHPSVFDENYIYGSGKLDLLIELTQNSIDGGHRLLVFSQYTSMLSLIREQFEKRGIRCFYLDGKTPSYERVEMSQRFNDGEREVFLISLKAGGTGLNLTGADTVIHYDPWWNPAAMDQASDRAYRIGQTRAVQVIKLVSRGTIEEKIIRLQESKRSLANDIIQINNDTISSLSREEIISLFE